jgi:uncharacterized membrane protein
LIKNFFFRYFELAFWVTAIVLLATADPSAQTHFSLCPLKLLGFTWCPGCGLGHAISWLFHGDLKNSLHAHWLGMPAVILILCRILSLFREKFNAKPQFQI